VRDLARILAAMFIVLSAAGPAVAQDGEHGNAIAVSYTYMQAIQADVYSAPVGWLVTVGGNVNRRVAPVGELAVNYRTRTRGTLVFYTLQGGVRFAPVRRHGATPFGQIVAGVAAARCCGDVSLGLVFEPGGGVDIPISPRTSVQLAAGIPIVLAEGGPARLLRLRVGLSLAF
jgi:hypothetical protein